MMMMIVTVVVLFELATAATLG